MAAIPITQVVVRTGCFGEDVETGDKSSKGDCCSYPVASDKIFDQEGTFFVETTEYNGCCDDGDRFARYVKKEAIIGMSFGTRIQGCGSLRDCCLYCCSGNQKIVFVQLYTSGGEQMQPILVPQKDFDKVRNYFGFMRASPTRVDTVMTR